MNIKNHLLMIISFLAFAAAAFGQTESTREVTLFGAQSINPGQSLRLTLQNPRLSEAEIIPCVRVTVVFDVYENAAIGEIVRLRHVRRVTRELSLDAGEAATLDFPASRTGESIGASVIAECDDGGVCRPRVAASLGLRESGRTLLNFPAVVKGFDPQPDPPATR